MEILEGMNPLPQTHATINIPHTHTIIPPRAAPGPHLASEPNVSTEDEVNTPAQETGVFVAESKAIWGGGG